MCIFGQRAIFMIDNDIIIKLGTVFFHTIFRIAVLHINHNCISNSRDFSPNRHDKVKCKFALVRNLSVVALPYHIFFTLFVRQTIWKINIIFFKVDIA
ncbi:hypothetical protein D9M72_593130 [compost metagenome]